MDGENFRSQMGYWYGGLFGFTALFPFLLYLIVGISGCAGIGGACGAVAVVAGIYLKPPVALALSAGIGWKMIQRVLSLKLGKGWVAAVVCWMIAASAFFTGIGNFWGANFSMGLLYFIFPPLILVTAAFTCFLCFDIEAEGFVDDPVSKAAWIAAAASAIHISILQSPSFLLGAPLVNILVLPLSAIIFPALGFAIRFFSLGLTFMPWIDAVVFIAALITLLLRHSWSDGVPGYEFSSGRLENPTRGNEASRSAALVASAKPVFGRKV
jgi:hypothetical protein